MAEEIKDLPDTPITITDNSFGLEDLDFADSLLTKTKTEDLETIEAAQKKEAEEKLKKEKEAAKKQVKATPEKTPATADDLLEEEEENPDYQEEEVEDPENNQFEAFSKGLVKLGLFSEEGDLPKTGEEFAERFNKEKQQGATDWLNDFLSAKHGEEGTDLFKAIFVDGVDPREYFSVHNENLELQDLDMTNDLNQKKVFREFYKRLNWDETKIEAKLQKSIDYGDLESDSTEFYQKLLSDNEVKLEELKNKKQADNQRQLQEDGQYRTSVSKILEDKLKTREFNGIPLNPEKVRRVIDFMTTKKYQTPDKQQLTEFDKYMLESRKPENIDKRILTALLALDNFNFDSIKKRAITKETDDVFSDIKKTQKTTQKQSVKEPDWFAKL